MVILVKQSALSQVVLQFTSFISILSLFLIAVSRDWWYITCSIAILTVTFSFYIQKDSTYYPPAQRLSDTKHFWMSHYEGHYTGPRPLHRWSKLHLQKQIQNTDTCYEG